MDSRALDFLVPAVTGRPSLDPRTVRINEVYGAQLGEMVWHSIHVDDRLEDVTVHHADVMRSLISEFHLSRKSEPLRIIEVGAYAHYSIHMIVAELNCVGVTIDISRNSLSFGESVARRKGISANVTLVAGDFHDLPFDTGFFDLVFIASSVHHTFRPWIVMQELFRITRPGGIVHLENEPIGREFCFYQYRGNRLDQLTPFETAVHERGLTWTLTSPFPGSRAEELFGMIENDRIPINMYLDAFTANGEIAHIDIGHEVLVAEFEQAILALPRDHTLPACIACQLEAEFSELAQTLSARDILMGFAVPRTEAIWRLSYAVSDALRRLGNPNSINYSHQVASLFGAPLRATIIKRQEGQQSDRIFRRKLEVTDGVFLDTPRLPGIRLELSGSYLPDIDSSDPDMILATFADTDWIRVREAIGRFSLLNRSGISMIKLPELRIGGIIMLRFYATAREEGPYMVQFLTHKKVLDNHLICQSESRLSRFFIPSGVEAIAMRLLDLGGAVIEAHARIHLSIARLIPVAEMSA